MFAFIRVFILTAGLFLLHGQTPSAWGSAVSDKLPNELKDVGVTEHLGSTVSLQDYVFVDESGKQQSFSSYFQKGRPVLLALIYYECPNLCNFLLNGLVNSLKNFDWTPGKQFEIVAVSINPKETPALAKGKKEAYLKAYGRPESESGWHFLVGDEDKVQKLAKEVGFGYRYDEKEKQYAHSSALFVLTPEGKISRYLYGIEFALKDLRFSLLEASHGKIGTVMDQILLFCFRYDPVTRKYSIYLTRLMQIGSGVMLLLFGGYLAVFWRRERKGAYHHV